MMIAALAMIAMASSSRADDDDAYFACVIGTAEAIMKDQAQKDAAAALDKAYAQCQPIVVTQGAGDRTETARHSLPV
ncbi:hypothetical protein LGH82_18665 [Mesorhizobium sp. PAMC28654]|uniref:hypothetical protein n=1 Tax=Mesorhizobium sp. PAMC28654 TaxID=2880934 RepID=UPI001D0A88C4|nr:hypothetical protein [Mesorhizobium sp. PAMC28654]UDL87222.1 hypothetical protein LGH82_18665 [Mesorhizobium sp. PAMC28654]